MYILALSTGYISAWVVYVGTASTESHSLVDSLLQQHLAAVDTGSWQCVRVAGTHRSVGSGSQKPQGSAVISQFYRCMRHPMAERSQQLWSPSAG